MGLWLCCVLGLWAARARASFFILAWPAPWPARPPSGTVQLRTAVPVLARSYYKLYFF